MAQAWDQEWVQALDQALAQEQALALAQALATTAQALALAQVQVQTVTSPGSSCVVHKYRVFVNSNNQV